MKAHIHTKVHPRKGERGQGLVEMALILPFLLILVVGLVEAGIALNRQLTVVNAAREGARFGAFGATPGDVYEQTLAATSQMFQFTEEDAVVAVINATVNGDGTGFAQWTEDIYPADVTTPYVTQDEVLADLREEVGCEGTASCPGAANVRLVVVDVRYDHQSVLGLPFVGALAGRIPIGSWTAMRLPALYARNPGCCAYPITPDVDAVNWPDGWKRATEMLDIRIGSGSGMFGWLYWDPDENGNAVNLETNLTWGNGCRAWTEFKNACDSTDTTLNVGDWVSGDSGESVASGVREAVEGLQGRYISLPVWDQFKSCNEMPPECDCNPGSELAHIVAFVTVEIIEVYLAPGNPDLPGNPKTISVRFIEFNDICK